jgi:hypothetical protein
VEPQNHPEQGHEIHPFLPSLWRGGRPPHGPGIWVTLGLGLRQGHQLASPRGLAGPTGRGPHRGPDAFGKVRTGSEVLPGPQDMAQRLQRRGPSPKTVPRQSRPPQTIAPMGGTLCHCQSAQARHLQAGQQGRRRTHQRLEHPITMLLLPLERISKFLLLLNPQLVVHM